MGLALLVLGVAHHALSVPAAIVLGVVEGVTEFLPISSTGHLTVAERLLDLRGSAADAYLVVIQAGAILAVVVLYRSRIASMIAGVFGRDEAGRHVLLMLVLAFVPAAVLGFAFGDTIKDHLLGVGPVAVAWAVGGLAILVLAPRLRETGVELTALGARAAFVVGLAQALALWPGVSRSLVTILAGLAVGLALPAAVEFSFLLGLLTLGAATAFDALKHGPDIVDAYGLRAPVIGFVVAFVAAVIAVRWMVSYLERGSLTVFGYYRLAAAGVALLLLATGAV
ncbi:MAG: undecaprenyl-diphosphate phosphatase [Actinobacteria bacterium]|nr:undecaprenyl-diphosphate phosphatase [Actinomycetota bacterium]